MSSSPRPYGFRLAPGYRALGLLQRGRDFETYDAWSDARYSRCVVKILRADRARSRSLRTRLLLEGRLLSSLDHPHLVRGYEVWTQPRAAIVLQTLGGATLSHLLGSGRDRLSIASAAHLGQQLASALQYLHDHGHLHLDVKPGNVIIDAGTATLIDLSLTQPPGRVARGLGTAEYLSPEQGAATQVSEATDVWGLGLTLYESVTGARPFRRSSEPSGPESTGDLCPTCGERLDYPQVRRRARGIRELRRVPRPLAEVVDGALEPSAADRPTMDDLRKVFAGYVDGNGPPW